jgi:hypothetical protein
MNKFNEWSKNIIKELYVLRGNHNNDSVDYRMVVELDFNAPGYKGVDDITIKIIKKVYGKNLMPHTNQIEPNTEYAIKSSREYSLDKCVSDIDKWIDALKEQQAPKDTIIIGGKTYKLVKEDK